MSLAISIRDVLKEKIVVFDGAMGTSIQKLNLTADDFGGSEYEGCNEYLVITRPHIIAEIHRHFLRAGADVVETDTFGATGIVLSEYHLQDRTFEINQAAAVLARQAADEFSAPNKPRFVAGSMGPTTKAISVTGGVTFSELVEAFREQATGLIAGGVDLLLLETCQDTRNVKAGIIGIRQALQERGVNLPIMVSGTIEPMGTMLAGQDVEALCTSLEHVDLLGIGLNCATGPSFMTDHIRSLSDIAHTHISCFPNAGLPDENGRYNETPDKMVAVLKHFVEEGWVNMLGGCCGTTPEHITAIAELVENKPQRNIHRAPRVHFSGIDYLELERDNRPLIVGERTNVIGSRMFKRLISEGKFEEASEIARRQVRNGAQIIDVCLANPDRDEMEDMDRFLGYVINKVKVPLMIDSTDPAVIERSLQYCQGKSIINSVNLEDGEERFAQVVPIAQRYGAALIVGCIDDNPEQGMAVTVERKLEIAQRSYDILTKKYGIKPQNLIFDPLVFPCGTGDENYIGSAEQTINGVAAIKKELPDASTILGISNVSFGLPPAGREVLNAVFLYHCTKAGLDFAIVNAEKLERYASLPAEEKKLAEDLIFNRGDDPISAFAAFYKEKKVTEKQPKERGTLEERLPAYIIEGSKDGLIDDLNLALQRYKPLEIVNGPLMRGMDEVGRLFNNNELIVAEVLQSAEAMKAAVAHLEQFMEKSDVQTKGSILLATVKGDVHDIGKNLVEIIFSNNGYNVINLGIKVPPEELIQAFHEHQPDMIGLSGLLVKSAQQMVVTAQDLQAADIRIPILVGGAALSNQFTRNKIAPQYENLVVYAKDAMNGLDLANQIMDPRRRQSLEERIKEESALLAKRAQKTEEREQEPKASVPTIIRQDHDIPSPPDYKIHILDSFALEELYPYLNLQMLMGKHLGLRGNYNHLLADSNEKALELKKIVDQLQDEIIAKKMIRPRAVFRFFPVKRDDDEIVILDSARISAQERFLFPRQSKAGGLCLCDFVCPGREDNLALFVTTCGGPSLLEWTERFKQEGQFLKSHALQAIAIECAEAFAELLHEKIRTMWGFPDPPAMTLRDKLHAKYRGIRVSFGYPACPRMEDQTILFHLLDVEKHIDVALTEGYMMEPEASVSAVVFHHPDARYFNVSEADVEAFEARLLEMEISKIY
ncbi:MAG: methionine synthase [Candidatus Omnitrophota bacterium]|jgi:5-methyltetrahydrofolate--homocysteine methyltransferase|nr:MAG: methionine synthase [Candidatus Omnitrophota bacterium]